MTDLNYAISKCLIVFALPGEAMNDFSWKGCQMAAGDGRASFTVYPGPIRDLGLCGWRMVETAMHGVGTPK